MSLAHTPITGTVQTVLYSERKTTYPTKRLFATRKETNVTYMTEYTMQSSEQQRQRASLALAAGTISFMLYILGNISWNNPARNTDYGHTNLTISAIIAWATAGLVSVIGLMAVIGYQRQKRHWARKHPCKPVVIELARRRRFDDIEPNYSAILDTQTSSWG